MLRFCEQSRNPLDKCLGKCYNRRVERARDRPHGVRKGYTMKQFTITYVSQRFFGQGFARHTEQVLGAKAALRVLKSIRGGKNPALVVWVSCR